VPYTLEDIAAALVVRMREVQATGPYYLAGLCVNGVIAYEMARQLILQGHEVALLGLFDAQNPAFYQSFSQEGYFRLLWKRAQTQFANLKRQKWSEFAEERLVGIRRHLSVRYWRIHNAFHLRVNEKGLQDLDTIVHPASFVYRPGPHTGGAKVVFFQSTDWPDGRYWQFHASWDGLIPKGMEVFRIPGGHESMFYEENVDLLASKLKGCLSEAMCLRADAVA
jgi:thioesterase domain-containing protein